MKKLLLLILALLIMCGTVTAGQMLHYKCNGDWNSTGDLSTGYGMAAVGTGQSFNIVSPKLGSGSCNFTNSGATYMNNSAGLPIGNQNHTFAFWQKLTAIDVDYHIGMGKVNNGSTLQFHTSSDAIITATSNVMSATLPNINTWEHIVVTYWQNQTIEFYMNNTRIGSVTASKAAAFLYGDTYAFCLNSRTGDCLAAVYGTGQYDDVRVYNESLTAAQIDLLWNGGVGTEAEDPFNTYTTDINFTAKDDFNASSISSFSVNVSWPNGTTTTHYTAGGTITLINISESAININVTYWNVTDYFNQEYYNIPLTPNTTNNIERNIHQAEICFNATDVLGNAVTPNNFTIGSTTRTTCFNLTAETHSVTAQKTGWYNKTQSVVVTALQNSTETITGLYSTIANISVYQSNGTILSSYGIKINSSTYPSWTWENGSTTNGSYYFNGINATYYATINSSLGNETFSFTISTAPRQNFTYQYFTINNCSPMAQVVLNFTIRNEDDDALINNSAFSAWFNITSLYYVGERTFNISHSSGNYYLICIPNGTITNFTADAQIKYSNLPTYVEKNYYLYQYPLSNSSTDHISIYLNSSSATQVKLQVRDYADDGMSDVYIKVLSYDLGTNSYKTTEIVRTDSDGDAYAQIVLDTYWYAFILEQDGEIILQTLPTKITSSPRTFRITSGSDYFDNYDVVQGISHLLSYNNATTTFSLTYSDPTGGVTQGCLRLTKRSINGDTLLNTSCETSTAATILMNISDGSVGTNTYIADAYVIIGSETFVLNSTSVNFNTTYKMFGASGLFLSFLVILVLVMVGIWHPVVAIVMMVVGVVVTNVLGLFFMNWTYIITFIILAVLTIYRVGKSD